jgi:hypothetical protein
MPRLSRLMLDSHDARRVDRAITENVRRTLFQNGQHMPGQSPPFAASRAAFANSLMDSSSSNFASTDSHWPRQGAHPQSGVTAIRRNAATNCGKQFAACMA